MMLRESPDRLAVDMPNSRTINYGDKRFTVRGIKRAIDGALGPRGAWLLEPCADLPSTSGMNTDTLDDIRRFAGSPFNTTISRTCMRFGDRGNREALNIFEQTLARHPEKNGQQLRWRIEHAQHLSAADIPRFKRLGVIGAMQGVHATSDAIFVLARSGRRAEEGAYVWQKLLKSGAIIANGTDAPVEDIDPIASFHASVARKLTDGTVFYPDQRMTRMQALRSYTLDAAYAGFEETIKAGSLTVGKLADITVVSKDLLTIPEDQIPTTRVLYTIVGGKVQFTNASVDRRLRRRLADGLKRGRRRSRLAIRQQKHSDQEEPEAKNAT